MAEDGALAALFALKQSEDHSHHTQKEGEGPRESSDPAILFRTQNSALGAFQCRGIPTLVFKPSTSRPLSRPPDPFAFKASVRSDSCSKAPSVKASNIKFCYIEASAYFTPFMSRFSNIETSQHQMLWKRDLTKGLCEQDLLAWRSPRSRAPM